MNVCRRLRPYIREHYTPESLKALKEILQPALEIAISPEGFVRAAQRPGCDSHDATNYDAVWMRDAVWCALAQGEAGNRRRILSMLMRYCASPKQMQRLRQVIAEPDRALDPMQVIHIRFDSRSKDFEDVFVNGKPEQWNHKQNDALGLLYQAVIDEGIEFWETLNDVEWEFIRKLPTYWERIRFWEYEDSGSWEEIERQNTSSIALVTSSLEAAFIHATTLKLDRSQLQNLIDRGYETILNQLPFESPSYPKDSPKYREADAALLNLIYPARLRGLNLEKKVELLRSLKPLLGERGIRRYNGDVYQAAGYWQKMGEEATRDSSSESAFVERAKNFEKGTEAEWFFDSWMSLCWGILAKETGNPYAAQSQLHFLNRSLAQVTDEGLRGADGKPVPGFALPESYNVALYEGQKKYLPSPITPLNWAKASLALALKNMP